MASKLALAAVCRSSARWRTALDHTVGALRSRSIATATVPLFEKKTMKVPSMGDSITEGTIVEWTAEVGHAVKDGDVVVLVETDKVTVEIKAEVDGVITQRFGAVDETVEVGANLYELDTDATATVEATSAPSTSSSPAPPPQSDKPEPINAENAPATAISSEHRAPSIKFLGKEGWEAMRKPTPSSPTASTTPSKPNATTTLTDSTIIHPMYGRPRFTEAEIEALLTGGATVAPRVLSHSTGAKFRH